MARLIRCRGCDMEYTPQGLSQHVSKTRDPRCQPVPIASQAPAVSSSTRRSAMLPSLNPIYTLPSRHNTPDPQDHLVDNIQMSYGAFVAPHVVHIFIARI